MDASFSWALWAPILIIFGAAVIVAVVQRAIRDPCLKRFHNAFTLVLRKDGKWFWGDLRVLPKCLVLDYLQPHLDSRGYEEQSYVFYEQNMPDIQLLIRPAPRPGTSGYDRWRAELNSLRSPSWLRRVARQLRNFIGILRDAFTQSLGVVIGVFKQRTAFGRLAEADRKANEVGQRILTAFPNSYEPILEEYLYKEVAVEMVMNAQVTEHAGLLDDYTEPWVLLHDVHFPGWAPPEALRPEDESQRFSIIFNRRASVVRHRVRRRTLPKRVADPSITPHPAPTAFSQPIPPSRAEPGAHPARSGG